MRFKSDLKRFEKAANGLSTARPERLIRVLDAFAELVTSAPKTTFTAVIAITIILFAATAGWLPNQNGSMKDHISTNVDQYIPEGTEEKHILDIVRQHWATKMEIIFIKTGNAYDKNCKVNVTNRDVLEEISSVEGDDFYPGANFARGDRGEKDYISYVFSLAVMIKEINSSSPRMANVLENEMALELKGIFGADVNVSADDQYINNTARYAIPQNQSAVDQIIAQIPYDVLTSFCADTNDDGIWDTTYSMFGCIESTPDEEERNFIDHVVNTRRTAKSTDATTPYFHDKNGEHHTYMIQTGLIAIMIDITNEANKQLMETMPLAIFFVVGIMLAAHRSWKVFFIAGLPLLFTLVWTMGIITLTNLELSPLIVAAMPMLIGLSVDYALHISNRITEFELEGVPIKEGIKKTLHTTGVAVLLSTITTIIGFAALLIAPLSPIRMLGLMLIVGIASAFLLSITVVPCLVIVMRYQKPELKIWKKVAEVPVRAKWPIIVAVLIVVMLSLVNLSVMTKTPAKVEKDPDTQGIKSLDAIIEFSKLYSRGSTSMLVLEPNEEAKQGIYRNGGALNNTRFLDQINWLEENITQIEKYVDVKDVSAMTIVDLFKSVVLNISWQTVQGHLPPSPFPIPVPIPSPGGVLHYYYTVTYWDFIHLSNDPQFQRRAIRIFYDSLTKEARDMLMTPDYSMTLCMIRYPYVGRALGQQIVDHINEDVDDANTLTFNHGQEKATLHSSHATLGAAISLTINRAIMETQYRTLFLSLIFVFIALLGIFRSWRYAILTMIPVLSVVGWQPIVMKSVSSFEAGASLNFMTAMISSVVIGAGIDFGVHITERIREEGETIEGIKKAVQHTGQSIMEANLTTVAGLSGGLFVAWFRGFFSILLILLLYSMFAGMILLPAVYAVLVDWKNRFGGGTGNGEGGDDPGEGDAEWDDEVPDAEFVE